MAYSETSGIRVSRNYQKVIAIFREVLSPDPERDLRQAEAGEDWEWDSLAHVTLIGALESEFGISIDIDTSLEMTSFGAVLAALENAGVAFEPGEP